MAEQANYMSILIENLLSLSRIELNQDNPPEEKIVINPIIEDAVDALSLKAQDKKMNFEINVDDNVPEITADKSQIRQLLQNLCDNAIKYGDENTTIKINVTLANKVPHSKTCQVGEGNAIAIAVNNQGMPIGNDELGRLTERFYRVQAHKDKNIRGTGLGLAIAKHILIRHKGNMRVTSDKDEGTTFTIFIPIEQL
jgi:two-component system phosphate regulon sensor histidine kinase PhoR